MYCIHDAKNQQRTKVNGTYFYREPVEERWSTFHSDSAITERAAGRIAFLAIGVLDPPEVIHTIIYYGCLFDISDTEKRMLDRI